jgi:hypothetical protein
VAISILSYGSLAFYEQNLILGSGSHIINICIYRTFPWFPLACFMTLYAIHFLFYGILGDLDALVVGLLTATETAMAGYAL